MIITKIKDKVKISRSDALLVISVALMSIISYNLGKIAEINNIKNSAEISDSVGDKPLTPSLTGGSASTTQITRASTTIRTGPVIASSKSKNKFYHFLSCPGASQISDKNKVTFTTEAEAIAAGYTLATNCSK